MSTSYHLLPPGTTPEPKLVINYLQTLKSSEEALKEHLGKANKKEAAFIVTFAKREQEIAELKAYVGAKWFETLYLTVIDRCFSGQYAAFHDSYMPQPSYPFAAYGAVPSYQSCRLTVVNIAAKNTFYIMIILVPMHANNIRQALPHSPCPSRTQLPLSKPKGTKEDRYGRKRPACQKKSDCIAVQPEAVYAHNKP
ncbi:putative FKBP12-interacting protein of 37 kDa [Corchorus olitorius]|uniref:FKBP12-interacting protein of 37 kDa n=1 Tax=Corchorus olitorius TaxID=93759 RepID=A0A1R3JM81_9ROSI|nr:putative FKBP12-interacting protein of 37 kDa [Corchorus olitorius]